MPHRTRGLVSLLAAALISSLAPAGAGAAASGPPAARDTEQAGLSQVAPKRIAIKRWHPKGLRQGRFVHTHREGGIEIGPRPIKVHYNDPYGRTGRLRYDRGRWYSPWVRPGFGLTELVASYNARTPVGTFIEISVRGRAANGRRSSWDSLGRWASHDRRFHRMSLGDQRDDFSRVAVDTLVTDPGVSYGAWQLRVTLMRRTGTTKTPTVTMIAGMSSRQADRGSPTSRTGPANGRELRVPRYSQMIHKGEYPQWDGGGEAWCSPTSTSMLLAYWRTGPTRRQYAWVNDAYAQPWVDYAARHTFAWGYDGAGMWPFNTAYAAQFGHDAFVTRLRSLREAERFIRAGVPLAASIAFAPGELDGSPLYSTGGHVVVIRGFTKAGRVIVNDPAAARAKGVRRVYKRGQFENAWVDQTGGVVYVIHPPSTPLPDPARHSNW